MLEDNYTVEPYTIPKMLGVKELSKEFNLPVTAIRQWINSGQLPVVVCGKKYLVNCTTFSKFLEGSPITNPQSLEPIAVGDSGQLYTYDTTAKKKSVQKIQPIF